MFLRQIKDLIDKLKTGQVPAKNIKVGDIVFKSMMGAVLVKNIKTIEFGPAVFLEFAREPSITDGYEKVFSVKHHQDKVRYWKHFLKKIEVKNAKTDRT